MFVELVRLRAEAALLRRLNAGYGFADSRIPAEVFLRDQAARKRLGDSPLRPRETHAKAAAELAELIEAAASELDAKTCRLVALCERLALSDAEAGLLMVAAAYAIDPDVRSLCDVMAGRGAGGLRAEVCCELIDGMTTRGIPSPSPMTDGRAATGGIPSPSPMTDRRAARRAAIRNWFEAIHPAGRLLSWGFVTHQDGEIVCADSVIHWSLGDDRIASRIAAVVDIASPEPMPLSFIPTGVSREMARVVDLLGKGDRVGARHGARRLVIGGGDPRPPRPGAVLIKGVQGAGKRFAAHAIAAKLARPLLIAPLHALRDADPTHGLRDALGEALLRDAIVYLPGVESIDAATPEGRQVIDAIDSHPDVCLLATRDAGLQSLPIRRPFHLIRFPSPSLEVRRAAWSEVVPAETAEVMAARYVIGPGAISEVAADADAFARASGRETTTDDIEAAVARKLTLNLGPYATRITRRARFDEMVLPHDCIATLHDMVAMVQGRSTILEDWGYGRHLGLSRGVSALFSGEPGTGKTMAASVISSELGLELFRIDLASVVSKFIGETEKHLGRIFDEAQSAEAMLLFDEADSLFGKRTEVKSSTDRYSNLEVNYILQRMESFNGISVLTTNHESAIDQAFMRRLNFRVRFPKPEAEERERLWRTLLPPETRLGDDLDLSGLAEKFEMTGGHIRNAIVRAAVIAAREGRTLQPEDLVEGAQLEYHELGKVMSSLLS